jgi:hypothetical protein
VDPSNRVAAVATRHVAGVLADRPPADAGASEILAQRLIVEQLAATGHSSGLVFGYRSDPTVDSKGARAVARAGAIEKSDIELLEPRLRLDTGSRGGSWRSGGRAADPGDQSRSRGAQRDGGRWNPRLCCFDHLPCGLSSTASA